MDNSGTATIDCEYVVLGDLGFTGTRTDRELQWLQSHGATSKNLVTAWDEFLTLQGVPEGSRPGRQYYWLLNIMGGVPELGGDTLIDLWHSFWCVHGGVVGDTQVPALSDPFFSVEEGVIWTGIAPDAPYMNDFSSQITGWEVILNNTPGAPVPITNELSVAGGNLVAGTMPDGLIYVAPSSAGGWSRR